MSIRNRARTLPIAAAAAAVAALEAQGATAAVDVDSGSDESGEEDNGVAQGEPWLEFLIRAAAKNQEAAIGTEAAKLWETFRTSEDLRIIFSSFAGLFQLATATGRDGSRRGSGIHIGAPPWAGPDEAPDRIWRYPYEPIRLLLGGNFKAKKLWTLFDKRCERPEYASAPCGPKGRFGDGQAVVVGAGPCGLRAAIELRLLGAKVVVVERRETFSRINQLHVWSWVGEEMKLLGARLLEPPPSDFGANPDLLHVCISDLQKLTLKVALLLGVEVLLGVDYLGCEWTRNGWKVALGAPFASDDAVEGRAGDLSPSSPTAGSFCDTPRRKAGPSPRAPSVLRNVVAVIGGGGFGSEVGTRAGMGDVATESASAIGIIANLQLSNSVNEKKLRSFSLAKQFYLQVFKEATIATGAELENIVCVKGHIAKYMVMTPTRRSLVKAGVIVDPSRKPVLARENLDMRVLEEMVKKVAAYEFKKGSPLVLDEKGGDTAAWADRGPRLFDFSKMRRSADGMVFLAPPGVSGADDSGDSDLLVGLVGDCLMEPFWPEGLGIIRGWFGVFDLCSACKLWAEGASQVECRNHFDEAFCQLKTISAATRKRVLRDNEKGYLLAPGTRYKDFDAARRMKSSKRLDSQSSRRFGSHTSMHSPRHANS